MTTKLLAMMYCKKIFSRFHTENELTFYSKNGYAVSFKGLKNLKDGYWQEVNVQIFKCSENGIVSGVAFYPKQTNSFVQVNPIRKYYSCYRKILNGEVKNEVPSKKDIKAFKKALWWFPFQVNLGKAFNE